MTDDHDAAARLELDEQGRLLGPQGPAEVIDLDDPRHTEALEPVPSAGEVVARVAPVLRRHRRALVVGTASALALLVLGTWWTGRPPYDVPDVPLPDLAPQALTVVSVDVRSTVGSPTAALTLGVRNGSTAPIVVATEHRPSTGVEVDRSSDVTVPPGATAPVTTRLLVHDCSGLPRLATLAELPRPVPWAARSAAGITFTARLGDETTQVSLPVGPATVEPALGSGSCADRPSLSAQLRDVEGVRSGQGWQVVATYAVRTAGVRVAVGREHFTSTVAGSVLATSARPDPSGSWWAAPALLDGGAGRIPVTFAGPSCAALDGSPPPTLPLTVTTPDRSVYAFELPADDVRLAEAAYAACGRTPSVPLGSLGWRSDPSTAVPAVR